MLQHYGNRSEKEGFVERLEHLLIQGFGMSGKEWRAINSMSNRKFK